MKNPRRFLVVIAHPLPDSFIGTIATITVETLRRTGHDVRVLDLYADDFDARLTKAEWSDRTNAATWPQLTAHVEALRWTDGLIFVYPTWFGGQPAILKGWFDRVWGEGIAYSVPADGGRVRGLLGHIRTIDVVTTHGSTKIMNSVQGEPGKRVILRGMRSMCGIRCRTNWLAFYGNDVAEDAQRKAFLTRVATTMGKKR